VYEDFAAANEERRARRTRVCSRREARSEEGDERAAAEPEGGRVRTHDASVRRVGGVAAGNLRPAPDRTFATARSSPTSWVLGCRGEANASGLRRGTERSTCARVG
jgi:hypothetical protein